MDGQEQWKAVVDLEGYYEVSDQGRVRRSSPEANTWKGRIKAPHSNQKGYLHVRLWAHGQASNHFVHCLVASAFIGARPVGLQVNHINGDKEDNRPINLEYVTGLQNMRHSYRPEFKRNVAKGSQNGNAKLAERDVLAILHRHREGAVVSALGAAFGVSRHAIERILSGRCWSHLTGIVQPVVEQEVPDNASPPIAP